MYKAGQPAQSVLRSDPVQNILCWLACSVHNRPPSAKFQILLSKLRQMADSAASLCIKSLGVALAALVAVAARHGDGVDFVGA